MSSPLRLGMTIFCKKERSRAELTVAPVGRLALVLLSALALIDTSASKGS